MFVNLVPVNSYNEKAGPARGGVVWIIMSRLGLSCKGVA